MSRLKNMLDTIFYIRGDGDNGVRSARTLALLSDQLDVNENTNVDFAFVYAIIFCRWDERTKMAYAALRYCMTDDCQPTNKIKAAEAVAAISKALSLMDANGEAIDLPNEPSLREIAADIGVHTLGGGTLTTNPSITVARSPFSLMLCYVLTHRGVSGHNILEDHFNAEYLLDTSEEELTDLFLKNVNSERADEVTTAWNAAATLSNICEIRRMTT